MSLRGYDIDGVLTAGVEPIAPFVVVSGRTFSEYDEYARRAATIAPVYIRGSGAYGDRAHAGRFKAQIVSMLGIDEFYEDDPVQADLIEAANPNCRVVRITP